MHKILAQLTYLWMVKGTWWTFITAFSGKLILISRNQRSTMDCAYCQQLPNQISYATHIQSLAEWSFNQQIGVIKHRKLVPKFVKATDIKICKTDNGSLTKIVWQEMNTKQATEKRSKQKILVFHLTHQALVII